jgi:hypothetical protein
LDKGQSSSSSGDVKKTVKFIDCVKLPCEILYRLARVPGVESLELRDCTMFPDDGPATSPGAGARVHQPWLTQKRQKNQKCELKHLTISGGDVPPINPNLGVWAPKLESFALEKCNVFELTKSTRPLLTLPATCKSLSVRECFGRDRCFPHHDLPIAQWLFKHVAESTRKQVDVLDISQCAVHPEDELTIRIFYPRAKVVAEKLIRPGNHDEMKVDRDLMEACSNCSS